MANNNDWLARTVEAAIDPDLPIVDPHHHLWDRAGGSRYMLEEVVADAATHNVRQTVFVECNSMYRGDGPDALKPVGEAEFVQGIAAQSASGRWGPARIAAGIVGSADLLLGDAVPGVLEALSAASPQRFRGVRHRAAGPDNHPIAGQPAHRPHLLLDPDFRRGLAHLRRYGLSFEVWTLHTDLADVADLAAAFPDTPLVLNHLGGPIVADADPDEVFAAWRPKLAAIAAHPNVVVKLGGIQMRVNGFDWHERPNPPTSDELLATNRRWYEYAIEQFGPARAMFESNFPVDKTSCSYGVLWNQFKKLSAGFPADERVAMFHDTAARFYRLPLAAEAIG